MKALLKFWKDFFEWIKKEPVDDICKYNLNKERCRKGVEEIKYEGEKELEWLRKELKKGHLDKNKFKKIANSLGRFKEKKDD